MTRPPMWRSGRTPKCAVQHLDRQRQAGRDGGRQRQYLVDGKRSTTSTSSLGTCAGSYVMAAGEIDSAEDTDGLIITPESPSPRFPRCLLVVQDGSNDVGNQNLEACSALSASRVGVLALVVSTAVNRVAGAAGQPPGHSFRETPASAVKADVRPANRSRLGGLDPQRSANRFQRGVGSSRLRDGGPCFGSSLSPLRSRS